MALPSLHPAYVVNGYIWDEFKKLDASLNAKYPHRPFYPINDSNATPTNKPYFIYNYAFRVSHGFYEMKKATIIYHLKAGEEDLLSWATALQMIIDRQDDAAHDVNEWNRANLQAPISFHSFRLYQNEPSNPRDSSASYAMSVASFMIVAEYHLI